MRRGSIYPFIQRVRGIELFNYLTYNLPVPALRRSHGSLSFPLQSDGGPEIDGTGPVAESSQNVPSKR